ncbi:DUF2637 domain-containing protein [Streptomyces sp. NPDC057474]|uniref:DUF2637 domain-containing protein n=1 Tax=Streptomyces sp. NPDC057474 TaxID=3346144 RepID=UPI0036858A6A
MISNPSRALAVAAGVVIVALTAAAFWLSYAHLAEVALANGMENKEIRAWAWPATLDLFIVAGELLMLRAALASEVDPWAIGLTVVGSGSSIALNVAGVGTAASTLDYVVAAVPPTAALLAFGALMRQIHQALAKREESANRVDTDTVAAPEVTVERVEDDRPQPALEPAPLVVPPLDEGVFWSPSWRRDLTAKAAASVPAEEAREAVTDPYEEWSPDLDDEKGYASVPTPSGDHGHAEKVTTSVGADTPRQVVTEVVMLTPSELRRRASKLNRELVASTSRPVTIDRLRDEFNLSRREAAELRREVVGTVAIVPGEARS